MLNASRTLLARYIPAALFRTSLLSRDRNFVFLEGRRQHCYSEELVCRLRINSVFPFLEHLKPVGHTNPHCLAITPYRRFLHETQFAEIWVPIGWFIIGGGIPALIEIHRAREVIHPIRLSQCYSPCEQGQRTENRNDCHEYCFHGSLLSSFNRRVSTPMELERHVL